MGNHKRNIASSAIICGITPHPPKHYYFTLFGGINAPMILKFFKISMNKKIILTQQRQFDHLYLLQDLTLK